MKLMFAKDEDHYTRVPRTESDWYGNLLWQARAYLSHLADSKKTMDKYHRKAYADGYLTSRAVRYCTIDDEIAAKTAWETLYALCKEANLKEESVKACVRWWLNGEPSDAVERETGIKANYLYQLRYRICALLEKKGPARFREIQRRNFISAA